MKVTHPSTCIPLLQALVSIFHFNDGTIYQHSDRDGDARERHDVGVDSQKIHRHKRQQHGHGNGNDGNNRRRNVPQEQEDD